MSIFALDQLTTPWYLYDDTWVRPLNPKLKFLRGLKVEKTLFFWIQNQIFNFALKKRM